MDPSGHPSPSDRSLASSTQDWVGSGLGFRVQGRFGVSTSAGLVPRFLEVVLGQGFELFGFLFLLTSFLKMIAT